MSNSYDWEPVQANIGDGYLISANLWLAQQSGWKNIGNIQGPKGEDGEDAVVYELVPEVSVLNADADGNIATGEILIHAYKVVGSARSQDILYTGADDTHTYNARFAVDGGSFVDCSERAVPRSQYRETYIPAAAVRSVVSKISLQLVMDGSTVVGVCPDITITRDGADAPYNVYAYARYDSREANATTGAPSGNIDTSYGTEGWADQTPAPTTAYPYVWQRIRHYTSAGVNDQTSYVCLTGATGSAGHTGRFYYYAGEYNQNGIYRIESTQAPYVKFTGPDDNEDMQTGFFMLDNGGEEPPYNNWPTDGHPAQPTFKSGINTPWTQMQSEHQYYIARAFFGENAYLGSFIINGDWMISQYGTLYDSSGTAHEINGTSSYGGYTKDNAYTLFSPQYPASSQPGANNFCPNFAVDGKTGNTIQGKGVFRGEVHATSGEFNGTVKASLFYSDFKNMSELMNQNGDSMNYTINPVGDPCYSFYVNGGDGYTATMLLPNPNMYNGLELSFFNPPLMARSTSDSMVVKTNNANWLYGIKADGYFYEASAIKPTGLVVLKAIDGTWWVVSGKVSVEDENPL